MKGQDLVAATSPQVTISFKNYAIIWCQQSQVDDTKPICEGQTTYLVSQCKHSSVCSHPWNWHWCNLSNDKKEISLQLCGIYHLGRKMMYLVNKTQGVNFLFLSGRKWGVKGPVQNLTSTNVTGTSGYPHAEKMKLTPSSHHIQRLTPGNSLAVQWLGLSAFTDMVRVQSLVMEVRFCKPHSEAKKIPQKTKTNKQTNKKPNSKWVTDLM